LEERPQFDDEVFVKDTTEVLQSIHVDTTVTPVHILAGTIEAKRKLAIFMRDKLKSYASKRKEPTLGHHSSLSPYLHYGHVSPVYIALQIQNHR
jgi:deoxyribodipyrimidine photo-lyase